MSSDLRSLTDSFSRGLRERVCLVGQRGEAVGCCFEEVLLFWVFLCTKRQKTREKWASSWLSIGLVRRAHGCSITLWLSFCFPVTSWWRLQNNMLQTMAEVSPHLTSSALSQTPPEESNCVSAEISMACTLAMDVRSNFRPLFWHYLVIWRGQLDVRQCCRLPIWILK